MKLRNGFIDGFSLKLIMAVLMLLDHLYYNLFPETLEWAHYLARVVAPVFTYLMTEGMVYTHNRKSYIRRMLGFGFGMLAVSITLHVAMGTFVSVSRELSSFTILISLGISAAVLYARDIALEGRGAHRALWNAMAAILFCFSFLFEGAFMLPLMALIFYYRRERPMIMCITYVAVFGLIFGSSYLINGRMPSQFYMIFAIIPILCYNGKRGQGGTFAKYLFYVFYPLHVWVIYLIEQFAK